MEARASFGGASVSKTFVASVLILVAMGLAAMGGYAAKSVLGNSAAATKTPILHAAPGTVLRQDKESSGALVDRAAGDVPAAALPSWAYRETTPNGNPRILQDDPNFINQYKQQPATVRSTGHRELP